MHRQALGCTDLTFSVLILMPGHFAVLPPPLETFTVETLQTAIELVGVASVYLHVA